jgi:hypothetical protein
MMTGFKEFRMIDERMTTCLEVRDAIFKQFPGVVRHVNIHENTTHHNLVEVEVLLKWWTLLLYWRGVRTRVLDKVADMMNLGQPIGIISNVRVGWLKTLPVFTQID